MKDAAASRAASPTAPNPFTWTFLGPQPIVTSASSNPFSGSIRDIVLDPNNTSVLYVLTYLGKVWKTSDAGQTWVPLLDYGPVTVVDKLVADPVQPNTLYAENGDLFVSRDGGQTWNALPPVIESTPQDCVTVNFAVSPSGAVWLAAEYCETTSTGLYRSTDGGTTWNLVLSYRSYNGDLRFHPANGNYAYVTGTLDANSENTGTVYLSADQGVTWSSITPSASLVSQSYPYLGSLQLAPAPSSPTTLYLLAGLGGQTAITNALYKSADAGASWQQATNLPPDLGDPRTPGLIAVHPLDPTLVFFGSVNLFRSQDGGNTWQNAMTGASGVVLHSDQHALVFNPGGTALYEANDGGIWAATKPYASQIDWTNLNTGLATAEIYSIAIDPPETAFCCSAFAGTQDNSTLWFSGQLGWTQAGVCGDGFDTAIDPNNAGTVYASSNGGLFRSTNGGGSWVQLGGGLPSLFGASIYIDGSTPNVLYASPSSPDSHSDLGLYQSLDGGDTWRQVFAGTGSQEVQIIDQVVISPSNSNIVYLVIGEYDTYPFSFQLWTTNNALANSVPTWQNVSTTTADNAYLAADPTNPEAIAMFVEGAEGSCGYGCGLSKNSVQTSSDGGATWQSIPVGGGLSQITVHGNSLFGSPLLGGDNLQLLIDPDIPGIWYLAAGVTVYRSSDSGQTWYPLATGLPLVEPGRLQMQRPSRTLWAPTAGRGVWELSIPLTAPRLSGISPQSAPLAAATTITVSGVNFDTNSVVQINGQSVPTTFVSTTELEAAAPGSAFPTGGLYYVTVYKQGSAGGVSDPPTLAIGTFVYDGGIVSSANASSTQLVPGAIMSIYGAELAPTALSAGGIPLSSTLGGVQVLVNNAAAPLLYVSPGQINLIVPWEVAGQTQATIAVQNNGVQSPPVQAQVGTAAPAIFTLNQQGTGQGAVLIAGTSTIAAPVGAFPGSRPANLGEYIEIYASGLGMVSQPPPDGSPSSGLDPTTQSLQVVYGCLGNDGLVHDDCGGYMPTYVGLAPGFPGLYQIDFQIPSDAATGDAVPLVIYVGSGQSNTITLAIH